VAIKENKGKSNNEGKWKGKLRKKNQNEKWSLWKSNLAKQEKTQTEKTKTKIKLSLVSLSNNFKK